jgi:hypothetical protein
MQSDYFGEGLAGLDDATFARCVVIAGAVSGPVAAWLEGRADQGAVEQALAKAMGDAREPRLQVRLAAARKLADLWLLPPVRQRFLDALPALWRAGPGARPAALAISGGPAKLDRTWLSAQLSTADDVRSVLFESPQPGAGKWEWPLRVGVPATQAGHQMHVALRDIFRHLQQVELLDGQDAIVDLLLLPDALPHAASLPSGGRVVADAVLVLGARGDRPDAVMADLAALLQRYRSGLAGSVVVPQERWHIWYEDVIRELAHNRSLPDVLFQRHVADHRRDPEAPAPLLLGDLDFVASTRIEDAAGRLAKTLEAGHAGRTIHLDPQLLDHLHLDPATASIGELTEQLKSRLPHFRWDQEDHEASGMVALRRALEDQLGRLDTRTRTRPSPPKMSAPPDMAAPAPLPEMSGAEPPGDDAPAMSAPPDGPVEAAPPGDDTREARHLQAQFFALPATAAAPDKIERLPRDADCRMQAHIGVPRRESTVVATERLDESQLPDSDTGHDLVLVYCPLTAVTDRQGALAIPPPQRHVLHLPPAGDSTRADFTVNSGPDPARFRARLIVLHENRVLQTLLLTCGADGRPSLDPENAYAPALASPSAGVPADIAFVINDNPQGVSGLAAMTPGGASFLEPEGLKESIRQMRLALSKAVVAAVGEEDARLEAEGNLKLMRLLANHGAAILDTIRRQHPFDALDTASRVQVVEAVDKAYFPIEFLYSGKAPRADAALCPNALAALTGDTRAVHGGCAHNKDRAFVCPAAFWGFDKCIERHASNGQAAHVVSVPMPGEDVLGPFSSALVAASERAATQMSGPQGLPATVGRHVATVTEVSSWSDWEKRVADKRPDLMVLLPHTADSTNFPGIPTLEVSKDVLEGSHLDETLVRALPPPAKGPLVLLLGCSTTFAEVPFLNFVQGFNLKGAPIVIGTLSIIHGTQAALLAERLLGAIADPQHAAARFDEAVLQVKRDLLAKGHGVAFTLIAYGHSSWRI